MQEQLLGHLLGALEYPEQEEVRSRLKCDAELRRQLSRLRLQLEPLEAARCDFVPPPGLADRTCRLVAARACGEGRLPRSAARPRSPRRPMSPEPAPPSWIGRISWLDVVVAAGIFVAASLLIVPAIQNSRFNARVAACQNNLKRLGLALTQYSKRHDDYFPTVPAQGKLAAAGIYAPILLRENLLGDAGWVLCPGLASADRQRVVVPSLEELQAASWERLNTLRREMGGSYGYCLGHMRGGVYQDTKNLGRKDFVLMADAPSNNLSGRQSANHGGRGQNALFEDLRVQFLRSSKPHDRADDFYANDDGLLAAGTHRDDSVVGPSAAPPLGYLHYVNHR